MSKIAIIGSGISGMGCAHFLYRDFDITVFEQDVRTGGHAHTVIVPEPDTGRLLPIDTGFMVFNRVTYPLLCRLFNDLAVPVKRTSMSFSVRDDASALEWCGSSVNQLFAQRKNIFNVRFLRMLRQVDRFNREAIDALDQPETATMTLRAYVEARDYGKDFLQLYLVPMSSAVWSTPPEAMMAFPAATLLRFFFNHGFLGLHSQHPWWTVEGGSREYISRLIAPWENCILRNTPATSVRRNKAHVCVTTADGRERHFDHVILATQADQALALLADPTANENEILSAFKYQPNIAELHTDTLVMPRANRAWASWNYRISSDADGRMIPATHYWMNELQGISERQNYFVSISGAGRVSTKPPLRRISYRHPIFNLEAKEAQANLPRLNEESLRERGTLFVGSYARYGFHEDGLRSAYDVCEMLLQRDPWKRYGSTGNGSRSLYHAAAGTDKALAGGATR